MNRFLKAFFVLIVVMFSCLRVEAAGSTPISGLKLTGDANGGNFNFTNLNVVGCNTAVVQWIKLGTNTPIQSWSQAVAAGGGLTNGDSGVTFGSLSVTANASNGTEAVNYQTMTGYVASAISGITNVPPLSDVLVVGNNANGSITNLTSLGNGVRSDTIDMVNLKLKNDFGIPLVCWSNNNLQLRDGMGTLVFDANYGEFSRNNALRIQMGSGFNPSWLTGSVWLLSRRRP